MEKIFKSLALAVVQGAVIGIVVIVFIFVTANQLDDYDPPEFIQELQVNEVSIGGVGDGVVGGKEILVNFSIINDDVQYKAPVYFDIEFFDKDENYIYGENKSSLEFISPKEKDNYSVNVVVPNRIDVGKITSVRLNVYEMKF